MRNGTECSGRMVAELEDEGSEYLGVVYNGGAWEGKLDTRRARRLGSSLKFKGRTRVFKIEVGEH